MFENALRARPQLDQPSQDKVVKAYGTTSLPVYYKSLGLSTRVQVPDLPLRHFLGHGVPCDPYNSYLDEHYAWKKALYPGEDEQKLKRSCLIELEAVAFAVPGLEDKGPALGLTADFVYTCDVDDCIETMDIAVAERCIESCVSILNGDAWTPNSDDPNDSFAKAQRLSAHYHDQLVKLLRPSAAAASLREAQAMVLGQLPELKHNRNDLPLEDLEHYLRLRFRPLGLHPLLTFIEHHCIPDANMDFPNADIELLKQHIASVGVIQNDLGGVEKDLAKNNRSNVIFALAELHGKRIQTVEDIIEQPHIIEKAAEAHDKLMAKVMETWADIQEKESFGDERVRRFADMALTLSVTHLQWTLDSQRYVVTEGKGVVAKRY